MSVQLPGAFLARASRGKEWADWLAALPRLITEICREWELTADGPVATGTCAVVVPVVTCTGERAAAKFGWPHPEAEHEHLALRAWAGEGAVRLLRADPRRSVLLLERADPSRDLHTLPILDACEVIAGLYGRLHRPAIPQLDRLSDHAARWAAELPALRDNHLVPRRFVEQASALAADFATDPATGGTLIHTDLHFANVLAAEREPWLVIDPKPLSGDPAYEVLPVLGNRWEEAVATGDARAAVLDRLFALVDGAGLDEERVRAWVTVRGMVDIMWTLGEAGANGTADPAWVTAGTTIIKAVQY